MPRVGAVRRASPAAMVLLGLGARLNRLTWGCQYLPSPGTQARSHHCCWARVHIALALFASGAAMTTRGSTLSCVRLASVTQAARPEAFGLESLVPGPGRA